VLVWLGKKAVLSVTLGLSLSVVSAPLPASEDGDGVAVVEGEVTEARLPPLALTCSRAKREGVIVAALPELELPTERPLILLLIEFPSKLKFDTSTDVVIDVDEDDGAASNEDEDKEEG